MTKETEFNDLRKCPLCAETVKRKAVFCKHCHSDIPPEMALIGKASQHAKTPETVAADRDPLLNRTFVSESDADYHIKSKTNTAPLIGGLVGLGLLVGGGVYFISQQGSTTTLTKDGQHRQIDVTPAKKNIGSSLIQTADDQPTDFARKNGIEKLSPVPERAAESDIAEPADKLVEGLLQAAKTGDENHVSEIKDRIEAIPKLVPGNSDESTRLNKLGLKDLKVKNYAEAARYFALAAKADPSDPKLLSNLGYAEMHCGNLDRAQKHLYSSIILDQSRAVAWGDLGLTFAKRNEKDKAVAALLYGYRVSNGETEGFLKSLSEDDDTRVRETGILALSKIQSREPVYSSTPIATLTETKQSERLVTPPRSSAPVTTPNTDTGTIGASVPTREPGVSKELLPTKDKLDRYMNDLQRRIKRAWFPPKGVVTRIGVRFKLHRDGTITDLRVEQSSGNDLADQAALQAVNNAAPFRPLPPGSEENEEIQFSFNK